MNKQLLEIINKQQQYEYLKRQLIENSKIYKIHPDQNPVYIFQTQYIENIKKTISQIITKQKRKRLGFFISGIIFLLFIGVSLTYFACQISTKYFYPEYNSSGEKISLEYHDSPKSQIQITIDNNALLTARIMLEEQFEQNPDNYEFYPLYIQLCEKEEKYDEAVEYIIEYLTKYLGKGNIDSDNTYYLKLKNYEYPISDETQEKINEFLKKYEYDILNS